MIVMVLDRLVSAELIRERKRLGLDRLDEVWDGVYMIMPLANVEHQDLAGGLVAIFRTVIDWQGTGRSFPVVNVSDRVDDWTRNYRCPDIAVYLADSPATLRDSYWLGGPDFAVEIVSPDDRSRDKLAFYAGVHTRELLIIDRGPWRLELYRRAQVARAGWYERPEHAGRADE